MKDRLREGGSGRILVIRKMLLPMGNSIQLKNVGTSRCHCKSGRRMIQFTRSSWPHAEKQTVAVGRFYCKRETEMVLGVGEVVACTTTVYSITIPFYKFIISPLRLFFSLSLYFVSCIAFLCAEHHLVLRGNRKTGHHRCSFNRSRWTCSLDARLFYF